MTDTSPEKGQLIDDMPREIFARKILKEETGHPCASYFDQLHHRYFECNYGETGMPFDTWFGTSHDGSREAHAAMRGKRKSAHNIVTESD